jgi:hypothetical protein
MSEVRYAYGLAPRLAQVSDHPLSLNQVDKLLLEL